MTFDVGAPTPKIESALLSNLKRGEMGGYAPNPNTRFRNQVQQTRKTEKDNIAIGAPKFLSEKAREVARKGDEARRPSAALIEHLANMQVGGVTRKDVPPIYGNVEIKYSKFGVDDFDFK